MQLLYLLIAFFARASVALALLIGLSACGGGSNSDQSQELSVKVSYYRNGCVGENGQLCLQMDDGGGGLRNFYDAIDGFRFEWGYRYQLRIRTTTVVSPPQDGSSIKYSLVELVSKRAEDSREEFSLWVPGADLLIARHSANVFTLADGKRFVCENLDCAALDALAAQRFWVFLVFKLGATPDDPLILQRITCSDSPASFINSCL